MIVVDASVLVEALLQRPIAAAVEQRLFAPGQTLHAPYILDIEVAQSVRRYVLHGEMSHPRGGAALDAFADFDIRRYTHKLLLPRVWELRNNFTAYDAAYVALAEILDAPLLTRDRRLAAAPGHHAQIELV